MVTELFLFGRPGGSPDEQLLDAFESIFEEPQIVLYVLGEPSEDYPRMIDRPSITEIIYDRELDQKRPSKPDISYLRSFESRLSDSNLWRAIVADRRLSKNGVALFFHHDSSPYSHTELLSHLEPRARVLENTFTEHDFDLVYGQQIMYVGGMLAYLLATTRSIPFFRIATTRISDRYTAQESTEERSPQIDAAFEAACQDPTQFSIEAAREYVKSVRDGGPLYTTPSRGRSGKAKLTTKNVVKFVSNPTKYLRTGYYYNTSGVQLATARWKKQARKWLLSAKDTFDEFDSSKEFVYFPLQVQPELALMIRARYLNDFPAVIRNVAQSLPIGMELFMNEHPNMLGVRETSFYERLKRLSNVRIIGPSVSTSEIIRNASVTVCINSTAGFESLFHDTPVVTLSEPSYAVMENVRQAPTWGDLTSCIRTAIEEGVDQDELICYVAANLDVGISHNQPQETYYEKICKQMRRSIESPPEDAWKGGIRSSD